MNVVIFVPGIMGAGLQGYSICEPVPAGDFENFVRAWKADGDFGLVDIGRT